MIRPSPPSYFRVAAVSLLCGGMAVYVLRMEDSFVVAAILGLGSAFVVGVLLGAPLQTAAVGSFVTAYGAALLTSGQTLDPGAPAFGVAAFFLIELLFEGSTSPDRTATEAIRARRWHLFGLAFAGLTLSSLTLVLGSAVRVSGPWALGAGGALAALLVGSILYLTRALLVVSGPSGEDR